MPDILQPVLRIRARQRAEREQPRHEADIGFRFTGLDELVHLSEHREVVPGLRRHGPPARDDARQRAGQLADRHEPATALLVVCAHRTPTSALRWYTEASCKFSPITPRPSTSLSGDSRGSSWRGWGDLLAAVVREDRVQSLPGEGGHGRALFGGENFQLVPYAPG